MKEEVKQILKRLKELKDKLPEGITVEDLVEKAKEREGQPMEGGSKKQIGVQMDVELWWKFKEQATRERMSAGLLLEKLVREYLEKADKR